MFLWYLSRATGVAALVLFTAVLVLGVLLSGQRRLTPSGQAVAMGVHRSLSLGSMIFLVVHIVSAMLDSYVHIGWFATVLPFTSGYETTWMTLGTLSFDVLIAVVATSLLRHRIGRRTWRWVHLAAYLSWPVAVIHSYALGTADEPILRGCTLGCAVIGVVAVGWRMFATHPDADRRRFARTKELV
ncbi:ferric reductase-like transmembrane domain-containing protein [Flexivirga oryzae]|uniref:Putative ferric reductase n=1 Tax=Flexivirga oryzae TaxID=1794944 RepID=A0A839N6E8_9MICO|nr:ferric reductase-like transmembrane domain-containing protein [Flexivirga oryzae]MBB2890292.1 putative ferric reductase [Flexivirga oryzae]